MASPSTPPSRMLIEKPTANLDALIRLATTSGLLAMPKLFCDVSARPFHGHPARTGSPKCVRMFSISRVASITWLGAGNTQGIHPPSSGRSSSNAVSLYAPSQANRTISQIVARFRLPMIPVHLLSVDPVDFIFDLFSDQTHQFADRRTVEVPRVRQIHEDLATDAPR